MRPTATAKAKLGHLMSYSILTNYFLKQYATIDNIALVAANFCKFKQENLTATDYTNQACTKTLRCRSGYTGKMLQVSLSKWSASQYIKHYSNGGRYNSLLRCKAEHRRQHCSLTIIPAGPVPETSQTRKAQKNVENKKQSWGASLVIDELRILNNCHYQ